MKQQVYKHANVSLAGTASAGTDEIITIASLNGETAVTPSTGYPERMVPARAAAYLGVAEETLAIWRSTKRYPLTYIKVGRLVQYRKSDLDAFPAARTVEASRDE